MGLKKSSKKLLIWREHNIRKLYSKKSDVSNLKERNDSNDIRSHSGKVIDCQINDKNWGIRMKNKLLVMMIMLIGLFIVITGTNNVYAVCSACDANNCGSCSGTKSYTSHTDTQHRVVCCCGSTVLYGQNHTGGTATCTSKKSCSKCGASYGDYASHKSNGIWYGGGAYQHYTQCSVCGKNFNYGSCSFRLSCPTCGASNARCSTCYSMDPSHSCHTCSYTSSITTYPSCTSEGVRTYTCSCGDSYTESIPATGHSMGGWYTYSSPTCTSAGESRNDCSNCSYYESSSIPATGHSMGGWYTYSSATCTSTGESRRDCSNCNYYESSTIPKSAHDYSLTSTTAATCSSQGSRRYDCDNCSDYYTETIAIDSSAHNWNSGTVTTQPTCTSTGIRTYTCTYNSAHTKTGTEPINSSAHNWNSGTVTTQPTCTSTGIRTYTCTYNSAHTKTGTEPINSSNHNYSIACTTCGEANIICSYNNSHVKSHVCDSTAPTINSLTASSNVYTGGNITLTGKATDSQSGIVGYAFTKGSASPSYTTIAATTSQITQTTTVTEADTYHFWVKDYAGNVNTASVTINKKSATITAKDQTITYGNSIATGATQVTASGLASGHSVTSVTLTTANTDVTTTGTITPSAATIKSGSTDVTSNYDISYVAGNLIINRKSISVPTGPSLTYNGSAQTALASTIQYTVGGIASATDYGTYTATVTPTGNYKWDDNTTNAKNVTWYITKRAVTITAKAQTITYGGSITTGTGQITATGLVSGHSVTAITLTPSTSVVTTTGTISPSDATIKSGTTDVTGNYAITYANGNLTINKKAVTITAKAQTITYGETIALGVAQTTQSGLLSGHELTAITLTPSTSVVTTTGTITPSEATIKNGNTDVTSNYAITYANGNLTINKKAVTITANAQTITYGENIATGVAQTTQSGLLNGHTLTAITLTPSTEIVTTTGTITPSAATIKSGSTDVTSNYAITYANGNLTINKKAVTITANAQTITYGETIALGVAQTTQNGLVSGHTLTAITLTPSTEIVTTTGTITPSEATIKNGNTDVTSNYAITYASGNLTINKKAVTITANAQTITYGENIAIGVAQTTQSGLLSGHTLTGITLTPSTLEATTNATITPSAATIQNGAANVTSNYAITYNSGKLIINKKNITVTWANTDLLFKNKAIGPTVTTPIAGVNGESLNLTVSGQQTNVGTHTATVTITTVAGGNTNPNNYNITNPTQSYTISADPNIRFVISLDKTVYDYEAKEHTPTPTVKATVDGKEVTLIKDTDYTVAYTDNKDAGTATVTITGIKNYGASNGSITFTINKIDLIVIPDKNISKESESADPVLTYTYTGNIAGETPGFTGALSRESGENAGFYKITIGTLNIVDNDKFKVKNYNLVFGDSNVVFTIEYKNPLIMDWDIPANVDGANNGTTVKMPIPANHLNVYMIMWGDGTTEMFKGTEFPTHTYKNTTTEKYEVRVSGNIDIFGYYRDIAPTNSNAYSNYYTYTQYLTALKSWGDIKATRIGFSQCKNLAGIIPEVSGLANLVTAENMFNGCEKLTGEIPSDLLTESTLINNAINLFKNCTGLTGTIPAGLFANNPKVTSHEGVFYNCQKLTGTIPTGLFDNATESTSFAGAFYNCKGIEGQIPENLFAKATKVQSFRETFANCAKLKSPSANEFGIIPIIPEKLFDNNKYVLNYYRTFYNCTGLAGEVTNTMFYSNAVINEIPPNAAINSNYRGTFEGCTGVTRVNANLPIIGHEMFKGCTALKEIVLPKVNDIGNEAFYGCNSLTNITCSNSYLVNIGTDSFEYTGTNPEKLPTYINGDCDVLAKYSWIDDNRIVDVEPPKGTIKIDTEKYPFTKTKEVTLLLTVEDNYSDAEECKMAIINEDEYDMVVDLDKLNWQDFKSSVDWTLTDNDGVKTVYVFFRDEIGNVDKVSKQIVY